MSSAQEKLKKRKLRIRKKINGTRERPRVTIYKSLRSLYVQSIDDHSGTTVASASVFHQKNQAAAVALGKKLAHHLKDKNINTICFDKNGYTYHGVVRAFAEAMRAQGIKF